jgi:hypothetical protein
MDKKIKKQKMAKQVKTTVPSAWIVNSNDRGRKSIKKGKVYLSDKEEFQIELFNPLQDCVLADIKLNGKSISKSGLVLNPGQRFYLDCFIDDKKKFIFKTYEVDETDETAQAIAKNGLLEVFFYKESVVTLENWNNKFNRILTGRTYPYWVYPTYPYWGGTVTIGAPYCGSGTTNIFTTNNLTGGSIDLTNLNTTTSNAYYSSNTMAINSSYSSNIGSVTNTSSIETGRIGKGDKSQQKFESVDMDFDKYYIASTILQILPESRRPTTASDLAKIFKEDLTKKKKEGTSGNWSHQYDDVKNIIEVKVPKGLSKDSISKIEEVVSNFIWEKDTKENREKIDDKVKSIELLQKLGELHKSGILTDEEFTTKKAELLSKI